MEMDLVEKAEMLIALYAGGEGPDGGDGQVGKKQKKPKERKLRNFSIVSKMTALRRSLIFQNILLCLKL